MTPSTSLNREVSSRYQELLQKTTSPYKIDVRVQINKQYETIQHHLMKTYDA